MPLRYWAYFEVGRICTSDCSALGHFTKMCCSAVARNCVPTCCNLSRAESFCFELQRREAGTFGLSCVPAAPKPLGFSHYSPRAQKCTSEGPGFQSHHQISTKRPPREKEERKLWREREKKSEILGGPAEGGPAEGVRRRGESRRGVGGAPKFWTHPRKF